MELVRLESVVEILDHKRVPISSKDRAYRKGQYPYYGAQGIVDWIDDYIFDGTYILVAEDGENLKSQNQPIAQLVSGQFWVNNHAHILGTKKGFDLSYVFYMLNSLNLSGYITGSAQPKLNQDNLRAIMLPMPAYDTQVAISNILSSLDAKIALNRRMNEELEGMAKMLYDYWFVQFDFPNEEGKPYKSSGGAMEYNAVLKREIPAGWKVKEINNLVDFEADTLSPSGEPTTTYKHVSIPSYDSCGDYQEEMGQAILSDKFVVTDSHVLVSKLNPWVNRVVWGRDIKNLIASTEFVMWQVKDLQYKSFLYYTAQTGPFIGYCTKASTGTSHSHRRVDPNIMLRYLVPFNETIVKKYSDMSRPFVEHRYKNLKEISNLTALRDKLLPLLMNGQVRVAD